MADNSNKRCPLCGGEIDYFDSCKKCGREWTDDLAEDEQAVGLPPGEKHAPTTKPKVNKIQRNKHTKTTTRKYDHFDKWEIDVERDSDTDIIRKRSLMRLDSGKIYNAMGLSIRAHDANKAALLWLSRLGEFLSDEEMKALTPTVERLKLSFGELRQVAQAKINEAAKMELAMEKAHKSARQAKLRLIVEENRRMAMRKTILPGQDTEGFGPQVAEIDPKLLAKLTPEDLMQLAKERLATLDQEKKAKKKQAFQADDETADLS